MRSIRKIFLLVVCSGLFPVLSWGEGAQIRKIDFKPGKDKSILVVSYSGQGTFRMLQSEQHSTVIIEAENLELPASLTRTMDFSKSTGLVSQITPYISGGGGKVMSKIVLQLRGLASVTSSEMPGRFVLDISKKTLSNAAKGKLGINGVNFASAKYKQELRSGSDELKNHLSANEKTEETTKKLIEVLNSGDEDKHYFGSNITFESSNASVHDIFRLVGETSELNIVTDSDISGTANYSVRDIPWDQLLDLVLQQSRLKAFVVGSVIRIIKLENYNKEQEEKKKQLLLSDELEPIVMSVIPLSYAKGEEMKKMIETFLTTATTGSNSSSNQSNSIATKDGQVFVQSFQKGKIEVDARSNSLIVTNTKDAIERIRRLVKELDIPLPQVLIDAKIVIATEKFSRDIGLTYGMQATSSGTGRAGVGLAFNGGTTAPQFAVTSLSGALGAGFQLGAGQHGNLNATLSLAETNALTKVIASPRVVVNNKVMAKITDGSKIYVNNASTSNGVTSTVTQSIDADLSLQVTPQVTSGGSILLKVLMEKSAPTTFQGNLSTDTKSVDTEVLVDNGNTLVLGGVYQFTATKENEGIPLLKDLPFIGQLFRTDNDTTDKSELMVFITPQILMPESAKSAM